MHPVTVSPRFREAAIVRRGRARLYPDRELDPARMALVVIDMQNAFCHPDGVFFIPLTHGIVPNVNRLGVACRAAGVAVVWVRHQNRADGSDWPAMFRYQLDAEHRARVLGDLGEGRPGTALWRELDVQPGDLHVTKRRQSALIRGSSALEAVLHAAGRDTLVVTGTRTNSCCEGTARDAVMLDFKVLFVEDATATRTDEEHQAALNNVVQFAGDVVTTGEVLAILAGRAGGSM